MEADGQREVLSLLEQRMTEPTARGLVAAVTAAIREGALAPGTRLPPIRTVGVQLGLSPTTVNTAWGLLGRSGAILGDGRRGTTVSDVRRSGAQRYRRAVRPDAELAIDLSTGVPDPALLPDLRRALNDLRATAGMAGSYLDAPVLPELVEAFAADWPYPAEAFTIADGAMDAIELIARALLTFGDRVVVEHPVFPPLLDLLESLGVQIIGVRLDGDGVIPAELDRALQAPVAAVIIQPRAQNPTGVSMSDARADQLARILTEHDVVLIEDDAAGVIAAVPAVSLGGWLPKRTLHIRSFSKSHGPDLRLAAVSGPVDLVERLEGRRQLGQGWTSRLLQRILLHLLTDERVQGQVGSARAEYARRRQAAIGRLGDAGVVVGGDDGLNLWIPVADEHAALVRLASQGIAVAPGAPFAVLPEVQGYVRATIGAVGPGQEHLVDQLADAAAAAGSWGRAR